MPTAFLLLLALLLRIWTLAVLSRDIRIAEPVLDASYYFNLAKSVVSSGHWPADPLFFGPFYPWLLSVLFHVGAPTPLTVQIFQSILGLAALALLLLAVRRFFGSLAAWIAGGLYALSGPILAMENLILMESVLFFFATLALYAWPERGRRQSTHLLFGLTCGILAAARATFLLLPLIAVAAFVWRSRTPKNAEKTVAAKRAEDRPTARSVAIITLGVLLPLIPQTIHQSRATGHFEVFTLNGGMNLYIGNNPQARGISSAPPGLDLNEDVTGRRSASNLAGRALTLEESSSLWRDRAFDFIRQLPGRALWLLGRKALLFLSPAEIPQVYNHDALKEVALPLRVAFVNFAWILPLAGAGTLYAWRSRERRKLIPWLALIATGWIQVVIFFATGRYRIAVMSGFLGLAGLGMAGIIADLRSFRVARAASGVKGPRRFPVAGREPRPLAAGVVKRRPLALAAGVVGASVILRLIPPGYPVEKARAFDAYYLGQRYQQKGDVERALAEYRAAAEIAPDFGEAWHGIGVIFYGDGLLAEAARAFEAALQRMPSSATTYYALGATYFQLREYNQAVRALETATRLSPRRPDYHFDYGTALARVGRAEDAAREWKVTLDLDPRHEGARVSLRRLREQPAAAQ